MDYIAITLSHFGITMLISSEWPLSNKGIRFFVPQFAISKLEQHPITQALYVLALGYYPNAKQHKMSRETHEDQLIMYCTDGEGTLTTQKQTYQVKKGDLMILPKSMLHQYDASPANPWSIYWVHFDGHASADYLKHIETPTFNALNGGVLSIGLHPRIVTDFESLLSIRQTGYSLNSFIYASNVLGQLLTYIALLAPKTSADSSHKIDLDAIHVFMEERLNEELSLETIASFASLSKFHFSKRYKALTGYSPVQHFIHMKMEKACYLLDITDDQITNISYQLGYEDTQYFSRVFKRVVGLSPRDYRKLN